MRHDEDNSIAPLSGIGPEADRLRAEIISRRKQLIDEECRLQTMALQVAAMQREINDMQSGGLFGKLARTKAKREERSRELYRVLNEARVKYKAAARAISGLQSDVATLEKELASLQRDRLRRRSPEGEMTVRLPPPLPPEPNDTCDAPVMPDAGKDHAATQDRAKLLQKAIDAGDEARKDILSEMETVSTLGRCSVTSVKGILADIMQAGRDDVAEGCAGRVSKSVERFLRKRQEALIGDDTPPDSMEFEAVQLVERCMREFCGAWLRADLNGNTPALAVADALTQSTMYLEKRMRQFRD